jgi:hypothetical protein
MAAGQMDCFCSLIRSLDPLPFNPPYTHIHSAKYHFNLQHGTYVLG